MVQKHWRMLQQWDHSVVQGYMPFCLGMIDLSQIKSACYCALSLGSAFSTPRVTVVSASRGSGKRSPPNWFGTCTECNMHSVFSLVLLYITNMNEASNITWLGILSAASCCGTSGDTCKVHHIMVLSLCCFSISCLQVW